MIRDEERYDTRDVVVEVGEQLRIVAGGVQLYVYRDRSGLHVAENADGARPRRDCIACGVLLPKSGACERIGCPHKKRQEGIRHGI